jgi:hypothetical protein
MLLLKHGPDDLRSWNSREIGLSRNLMGDRQTQQSDTEWRHDSFLMGLKSDAPARRDVSLARRVYGLSV